MAARTWLARASTTAAVCLVVVASLPASWTQAADVEAGRPAAWGGQASAAGAFYTTDQRPSMSPIVEFVYAATPEGESWFDSSGTAEGRASSYYAGAGGSNIASLLCLAGFPCPAGFPPAYPLSATAVHPSRPDASPQLSGKEIGQVTAPAGLTPGRVTAHADRRYVETVSSVSGFASPAGTAESITATTRQEFVKGVLTVRAESVVKGLLVGGVVAIDEVRAVSIARADGRRLLGDESTVTVTNVTVNGNRASLDDTGVHVLGSSNDAAVVAANQALGQLASRGIEMRLVGVTRSLDRAAGSLRVQASGVLVSYAHKVSDVPAPPITPPDPFPGIPSVNRVYYGTAMFGAAGTSVFADDTRYDVGRDIDFPDVIDAPTGDAVAAPRSPALEPVDSAPAPGQVTAPKVRRPAAARAVARRASTGLLPASVAERIGAFYLAGMLAVAAGILGGRLRSPARLPRAVPTA